MPLFHICPKSACCSCVCRGWPAQFAIRFLLFSGFPFFYGLLYLGLVLAWRWASPFFSPPFFSCSYLLPYHSIIPAAKLFASILPGLFRPTVYSSPNGPVRPLVLLFHHWRAPVSHLFFFFGRPWRIWFSWASLALKFAFPWAFTEFFGLFQPNHIIPHPWGSWDCHQPLTFLLPLLWAYRDPFSLFHIIYCPWFAFFFFFFLSKLL